MSILLFSGFARVAGAASGFKSPGLSPHRLADQAIDSVHVQ